MQTNKKQTDKPKAYKQTKSMQKLKNIQTNQKHTDKLKAYRQTKSIQTNQNQTNKPKAQTNQKHTDKPKKTDKAIAYRQTSVTTDQVCMKGNKISANIDRRLIDIEQNKVRQSKLPKLQRCWRQTKSIQTIQKHTDKPKACRKSKTYRQTKSIQTN